MCNVCPPHWVGSNVIHSTVCTARVLVHLFFKIKCHQSLFVGLVHGTLLHFMCACIVSFCFAYVSWSVDLSFGLSCHQLPLYHCKPSSHTVLCVSSASKTLSSPVLILMTLSQTVAIHGLITRWPYCTNAKHFRQQHQQRRFSVVTFTFSF